MSSSAATSSSGQSAVSGLGITFHPSPQLPSQSRQGNGAEQRRAGVAQHGSQPRSLKHSTSYDAGLSNRAAARYIQPMVRGDSQDSTRARGARIAGGEPEVVGKVHHHQHGLYQQQHHQLSPLSEFEHSSGSDSGLAYSPASLSSLPSSTNSAHGPYAHQFPYPGQLRHAQSMQEIHYNQYQPQYQAPLMEYTQSRPVAPLHHVPYHRPHPVHHEHEEETDQLNNTSPPPAVSSRLPAFLQNRQRQSTLARPKSMMELGQMHSQQAAQYAQQDDYYQHARGLAAIEQQPEEGEDASEDERYGVGAGSPSESVPSSAGGLQRRNLERQLQQQHRFYQEEKKRLNKSAGARYVPNTYPSEERPTTRARSRSMDARDRIPRPSSPKHEEEGREADQQQQRREGSQEESSRRKSEVVAMRSRSSMQGLAPAETGGAFVALDDGGYTEGEGITPQGSAGMLKGEEPVIRNDDAIDDTITSKKTPSTAGSSGSSALSRHSTLLTVGANPVRRSKELDRLLAPSGKKNVAVAILPSIADSPAMSASSGATTSTRQRASSRASSHPSSASASGLATSPVILEQAKTASKPRVELDVVLESALVVEGGTLKGRMEVRVRKPRIGESEVWVGRPKVRVVGFEELNSQDARHIFYHHASTISSFDGTSKPSASPLPCFDSAADFEGFHKARFGEHFVPFSMHLPIGKGAKGGWKGKQGVVRYIVIGSVKLKSENGKDRSIAHFYRHVEIYPYFNPAVLLAPALKPLVTRASKSLFMGGSGKVNLLARMHRANWVAGQRCYVDVRVENESSKKIKSLTLSLIRTTTIFRPRPHLDAGMGDADIDADACHTQTTRKKVAESSLEMGKKGSKGVTAKGNWIGVEGGETADFSHFLLVPHEALSISRGRHVEVTYAVKVSVGGSLSADVSADIPIRVVNFLSLDPPPGHSGDTTSAGLQSRSLNKSWSIDQLRGEGISRTDALRREAQPTIPRMASLDSLRLEDLNGGRGPSRLAVAPTLSRVASMDSIHTNDLSRAQSVAGGNDNVSVISKASLMAPLPALPRDQAVVGKALERQLTHRMSLECISSAIASATARRQGHSPTKSALRSVASSAEIEQWEDQGKSGGFPGQGGLYEGEYQPFGGVGDSGIQLDDLEEIPDDRTYFNGRTQDSLSLDGPPLVQAPELSQRHRDYDDSDDELELEAVMQSRWSEDDDEEEEEEASIDRHTLMAPPTAPRRSVIIPPPQSPASRSRPSSPVKQDAPMPKSAMKRSDNFAFATPTSPVKANADVPVPQSPVRRQASRSEMSSPAMRSAPRPLPTRPSGSPAFSSPTKASAAREQAVSSTLNKKASVTSLRRTPGVFRRPSSKSLRDDASPVLSEGVDGPEVGVASPTLSPPVQATSAPKSPARVSPTISISSPRAPFVAPSSPRKVAPISLRAARSMGDLRVAPTPPQRRPTTVLPSVKSKIAAMESRNAALQRLTGAKVDISRANSISSDYSDASFGLARANSMASFKAPLLRAKRKVHQEI